MKYGRCLNLAPLALTFTKIRPGRLVLFALMMAALLLLGAQSAHEAMALKTETINLNTGWEGDQTTGTSMPVGVKDNEWRVVIDPNSVPPEPPGNGISDGRPADVVASIGSVNPSLGSNYPRSVWISLSNTRFAGPNTLPQQFTDYTYAFYFTLPPGFSSPIFTMKLNADNRVKEVTLNSNSSHSCTLFSGNSGLFNQAPLVLPSPTGACFESGPDVNILTVRMQNDRTSLTGLIVDGTLTYQCCEGLPVIETPDLQSITFFESTFATPTEPTFGVTSAELANQPGGVAGRRSGALTSINKDFEGTSAEFYDVFYSDWDGTPDVNGQFVTIEAMTTPGAPSGGGLNIAAVRLNLSNGAVRYADSVASFVALGDNALPSRVGQAVDGGNLSTDSTMGNTSALDPPPAPQRLRLTVGVCPCASPPSNMVAWWPMDEMAGVAAVNDIASFPGSVTTDVATPRPDPLVGYTTSNHAPEPINGVVGGALWFFNGTHLEVPTSPDLSIGGRDFSIDAWVKVTAHAPNFAIVDKFDTGTGTGVVFGVDFGGLYLDINGTQFYSAAPFPVFAFDWIHVAVTVSRNQLNTPPEGAFYVNGKAAGDFVPPVGSISNSVPLWIANSRSHSTMGDFVIDELEIFNDAVSPEDILAIYGAGGAGKCKSPVGGIVALAVSSSAAPVTGVPLTVVTASLISVLAAAAWYAKRRWLRQAVGSSDR